jgi:hypothetical protein
MMLTEVVTQSATQARAILGAWQEGNPERLSQELGQAQYLPSVSNDSAESERLELLSAIASDWQPAGHPLAQNACDVYRKLLNHLAFPERQPKLPIRPLLVKRAPAAMAVRLQ